MLRRLSISAIQVRALGSAPYFHSPTVTERLATGLVGDVMAKKKLPEFPPAPKVDIRKGPPLEPPTLFDIAKKLVYGDRQKQYGDFRIQYAKTLRMYAEWKGGANVEDVADFMMLMHFLKLTRESHLHKEDNVTDAIAYLELYHRAREKN